MWNLKNTINRQNRQINRYREQTDGCQSGRGLGAWTKKVKGLRSTDGRLQNGQGDGKYSIGNIVNNIEITM